MITQNMVWNIDIRLPGKKRERERERERERRKDTKIKSFGKEEYMTSSRVLGSTK